MKIFLLLLSSFCLRAVSGQVTFTMAVATDPSISVTMSAEAVSSMISNITSTVGPGTSPTTLAAAVTTTAQTSIQVQSILGVTTCMGLEFPGGELSLITAISGSSAPFTLTVVRGTVGTTKSTYANDATVSFTATGNGTCMLVGLLQQMIQNTMVNKPGPLVAAQQAAIVTANATINSTVAVGITHTP
jgi:hypothetical protein